jgi:hypothetical protein
MSTKEARDSSVQQASIEADLSCPAGVDPEDVDLHYGRVADELEKHGWIYLPTADLARDDRLEALVGELLDIADAEHRPIRAGDLRAKAAEIFRRGMSVGWDKHRARMLQWVREEL